jgi:UDP-N-acetylmuramoyl-tripeptide--D-alanyl-D-alanine ligase
MKIKEIARAINGKLSRGGAPEIDADTFVAGVSTDSRKIARGEIFFAIRGKKYDGHDFAKDAYARSGAPVVLSRPVAGVPAVLVDDTLGALGDLAREYRRMLGKSTAAVTGTNGKTTTKEMSASVLSARYKVHKNRGNMNNLVGLPLSVLEMKAKDDLGVFEMGMSERGEIARMCRISEPSVGAITNIGPCHLEMLGSVEQVAQAKAELLEYLTPEDQAILNFDDPLLKSMAGKTRARVTGYGIRERAPIRARDVVEKDWGISFALESGASFSLSMPGVFNVYNALAAVGVGIAFGVSAEEASQALAGFRPEKRRMIRIELNEVTVIDDSYNANPVSVAAALEVLQRTSAHRRIVVLGDMLELGTSSELLHRQVGERIGDLKIDVLFVYGEEVKHTLDSAKNAGLNLVMHFTEKSSLVDALEEIIRDGDVILVKGSRAMGMEEVVEALVRSFRSNRKARNGPIQVGR